MMAEERIFFQSDVDLEGILDEAGGTRAVVICHPHPQYGGDMDNPVVRSVARAYRRQGYATLRFNFRGVGSSAGSYGQGRGERGDLTAALSYVAARGFNVIDLAGYSFGAWIGASVALDAHPIRHMILVSPPLALIDFANIGTLKQLALVIAGSRDAIAPFDRIRELLPQWNREASLVVIDGADHFFSDRLRDLETEITGWLRRRPHPSSV